MTITELGAIGEFVGAIVVVVTLIFLTRQIRQSTVQQKREETISVQRGQNEIISQFMDPMVGCAYVRTADGDLAVSIEDRMVAITWVLQYLNHFQIVYDLFHDGTLSRERYEIWERFAVGIVAPKERGSWHGGRQKTVSSPSRRTSVSSSIENCVTERIRRRR
jgi:hypothetical protein